jgi:glycosyltransferase involved in cell wall biosynthesis
VAISLDKDAIDLESRPIKVLVLGLRGIVDVPGGIETHSRKLYPLLARLGCEVEVIQRAAYYPRARPRIWHGVRLKYLWSPRQSALETAVHSVLGVLYAAFKRPDILHLHAVGPAFLAPLARLLGLRVVVTHHAADYRREKWGALARGVLSEGERLGMRYAHGRIVVSETLADVVRTRHGVRANVIPNGAPRVLRTPSMHALAELGLEPGRYALCVARIDRVKRQLDLIDAFESARVPGWKLALVGALDEADDYARRIASRAAANPDIVLAGFRQGRGLRELFSHCGVFVLASSLEGHPIALLEALSYGVPVLASDLQENRALPIRPASLFPVGDVARLAQLLRLAASGNHAPEGMHRVHKDKYSWRRAAELTRDVYERVVTAARNDTRVK